MNDQDDLLSELEAQTAQAEAAIAQAEEKKKSRTRKSGGTPPEPPKPESDELESEPAETDTQDGEAEDESPTPLTWLRKQPSFDPEQFLQVLQELRELIEERTNVLSNEIAAIREDVSTLMTTDEEYIDDEIITKPAPAKPNQAPEKEPEQENSASSVSPDLGIPAYRDPWFALLVFGAAMLCALAVGVGYGYMLSDKHLPYWGWQVLSAPSGLMLFPLAGAVLLWHGRAIHKTDEKQAGKYQKSGVALVVFGLLLAVAAFFV